MVYVPEKPTVQCPKGCGEYTINDNGWLRRHSDGYGKACPAGGKPLPQPRRARTSPASSRNNVTAPTSPKLSDAMILALLYCTTPRHIRMLVDRPSIPTRQALVRRGLLDDWMTCNVTVEGRRVLLALDKLPDETPKRLRDYWQQSKALLREVHGDKDYAESRPVISSLDDFVAQIERYATTVAIGSTRDSSRLDDIRRVLEVLYREAGR